MKERGERHKIARRKKEKNERERKGRMRKE